MVLPSFLSPNVPSAKLVLTSAHIACLSERSAALAKRRFRRFANSHARVAQKQFRAAYSIFLAGAFAKYLLIFYAFKKHSAAFLPPIYSVYFSLLVAPNYYFSEFFAVKDFLTLAAFG